MAYDQDSYNEGLITGLAMKGLPINNKVEDRRYKEVITETLTVNYVRNFLNDSYNEEVTV